ncbi:hypothetical protein ACHAPU_002797 [Fusarium lateritium]
MSTVADQLFRAKVQWWNNNSVHVLCPFCDEVHRHGFRGYDNHQPRLSHCIRRRHGGSEEYNLEFPIPGYEIDNFHFLRPPKDLSSITLSTHYSLPTKWKTVARLIHGENLPEVSAMSGWGHEETEVIQVAGRDWTSRVLDLCNDIGFTPERHHNDGEVPGRYNACHAEKQLIAYFVYKHLFLHRELIIPELPQDLLETLDELEITDEMQRQAGDSQAKKEEMGYQMKLVDLHKSFPPSFLMRASILVSKPACADCEGFLRRVNELSGLQLRLLYSDLHVVG